MPIFHGSPGGNVPTVAHDSGYDPQDGSIHGNMIGGQRGVSPERRRTPLGLGEYGVGAEERRPVSREELIERIKRGESPTWRMRHTGVTPDRKQSRSPLQHRNPPPTLLPAVDLQEKETTLTSPQPVQDNHMSGLEIERPRSALHSGDFYSDKPAASNTAAAIHSPIATSPPAPWLFNAPRSYEERPASRARAVSHSLSNVILMPPTSPLVQALNHTDLDYPSRPASRRRDSPSPLRDARRHTFSPQSFQSLHDHYLTSAAGTPRTVPYLRREGTFPYQAHQPRRAFTGSFSNAYPGSIPQTPFMRPRGISTSSEVSPLHHAPMVGSYEESILRGRMSTTPSRPLNFIAQIGVLGKGKCKASLRCPAHVTIPFPAVFYSYNGGNGRILDNQPSPYVGLIDIENHLPPYEETEQDKRRRRCSPAPVLDRDGFGPSDGFHTMGSEAKDQVHRLQKRERLKRRSQSPRAPPGGAYRIPQQGQLQIVIKNPNKTAVKLFLVPYDLNDMEPGTKTFIRQRSYSAGPIIDMPLSSRKNYGTDRPEAAISTSEDPNERPTLRYLIHLHICCPSKGRYYLYKSVRVVFANRVPDGKEKLRNEVQLPEPRYGAYKPTRDSLQVSSHAMPALNTASVADMATRRRSTPFNFAERLRGMQHSSFVLSPTGMDEIDGLVSQPSAPAMPASHITWLPSRSPATSPSHPYGYLKRNNTLDSSQKTTLGQSNELYDLTEGLSTRAVSPANASATPPASNSTYGDLTSMDASTAWLRGRESPSLIARRLRELERSADMERY